MRDSLSRRFGNIGRKILKISNNGRSEGIVWNEQSQGGLITLKVERERNQDGLCSYEAKPRWIHHIGNGEKEKDPNGLQSFEAACQDLFF